MSTTDLTRSPKLASLVGNDPENLLIAYADDLKDYTVRIMASLHTLQGAMNPEDEAAFNGAARLMASVSRDMTIIQEELYG